MIANVLRLYRISILLQRRFLSYSYPSLRYLYCIRLYYYLFPLFKSFYSKTRHPLWVRMIEFTVFHIGKMTNKNIYSPAYKGISLACSTLLELYRLDPQTWSSVSYSFNRKELKDHGEGGAIVGASLKGKNVLVIDDVVTAGTAMREAISIVTKEGGKVVGFVVALDRREKMPGPREKEDGVNDGQL